MITKHRDAPRQRTLKAATIESGGGAIDCVIRNRSATGAALDVASPLGIPHEFRLVVPTERLTVDCRVVWRKETRIGVAFSPPDTCPI